MLQTFCMVSAQNSQSDQNALNVMQVTLTVITEPDVSALWAHTLQDKQAELSKRVLCADATLSAPQKKKCTYPILNVLLYYTKL